jgi:hypothetical protein
MAYVQNELTGALFKNDEKEEETHADFNGSAKIQGVEYWINAWVKVYEKDNTKRKYYSLSFRPKEKKVNPSKPGFDDIQEDIPF